jgi:hypothetical protein
VDQDCDSAIDDGAAPVTWYSDADGDGFGNAYFGSVDACPQPPGTVSNPDDCDDSDPEMYPGAPEYCDGDDDDCDGTTDEGGAVFAFYVDADGDGYGDPAQPTVSDCAAPAGYSANGDDCDDGDPGVGPASVAFYADADADGFGDATGAPVVACTAPPGTVADATDCDDGDELAFPGSFEQCDLEEPRRRRGRQRRDGRRVDLRLRPAVGPCPR